jgi:hypothetical protein
MGTGFFPGAPNMWTSLSPQDQCLVLNAWSLITLGVAAPLCIMAAVEARARRALLEGQRAQPGDLSLGGGEEAPVHLPPLFLFLCSCLAWLTGIMLTSLPPLLHGWGRFEGAPHAAGVVKDVG